MTDATRCTYVIANERCILTGRETPPDDRILCRTHRDEVIDARINYERRMTRRASDARTFAPT
jgi:hypothetical protein